MSNHAHDAAVSAVALQELPWRTIADLLEPLASVIVSNWAVLLVKFNDDPAADPSRAVHEHLFTKSGAGSHNMVDFFRDMSHGQVDVSGTRVFGWFTLPVARSVYVGNVYPQPVGKLNRNGLLDLARATATSNGVDLSKFDGVVVSAYGGTDLCGWVGGMAALCDQNSLQPSLLGQEMGHGFGLDHARHDGADDDYRDPWDVMSTAAYPGMQQSHPEFGTIGPGLNAWNMRSRGWLAESRVWSGGDVFDATITLRPLHHRRLPGHLAAEVGEFLVEFRVPESWDGAIGAACVLVHRFRNNHSYLMSATNGADSLAVGSVFEFGSAVIPWSEYYRVEVLAIDAPGHTATVRVSGRPRTRDRTPGLGGRVFGGVAVGGGGFIIVGSTIKPVPPRGPARQLVEQVTRYLDVESAADPAAAVAMRRTLLADIARLALRLRGSEEVVSHRPPGYDKGHQD
jgi:hypothetical protein